MHNQYPKISIVIATMNQGSYLEESILSIISQGYPNLELVLIDGGSTDNTIEIIEKYRTHFAYTVSESDSGLYNALNKGFKVTTGEIMGWLNSDDILHRKSLFTISQIFQDLPEVAWVQGYPTVIDDDGRIVYHRPARDSHDDFLERKYHDGVFIQQESTYWKRSLWDTAGGYLSEKLKYAGDFEIWMRFFQHSTLYSTNAFIGAFRVRKAGQMSSINYDKYLAECDMVVSNFISEAGLPTSANKQPSVGKRLIKRFLSPKNNDRSDLKRHIIFDFTTLKFSLR